MKSVPLFSSVLFTENEYKLFTPNEVGEGITYNFT